jgi:hypothetical protein
MPASSGAVVPESAGRATEPLPPEDPPHAQKTHNDSVASQ